MVASVAMGQFGVDCDFFQTLQLNETKDIFSPLYPNRFPAHDQTMCRWSGVSPSGTVITVNCTTVDLQQVWFVFV